MNVRPKNFSPKDAQWLGYREYFINVARKSRWSDETCCVKLLGALDSTLLGVTADLPPNFTFGHLLLKLDHINGADFAHVEASHKLNNVKKFENESIALYAERVRTLTNRAYHGYLPAQIDEIALKHFTNGLPTKQGFRLKMKEKQFKTLHEAVVHGSNLDQILHEERLAMSSSNNISRSVEIENEVESNNCNESEMVRKSFDKVSKHLDKIDKQFNKHD